MPCYIVNIIFVKCDILYLLLTQISKARIKIILVGIACDIACDIVVLVILLRCIAGDIALCVIFLYIVGLVSGIGSLVVLEVWLPVIHGFWVWFSFSVEVVFTKYVHIKGTFKKYRNGSSA